MYGIYLSSKLITINRALPIYEALIAADGNPSLDWFIGTENDVERGQLEYQKFQFHKSQQLAQKFE